ncbi:MAG: DUF3035 domain-containing protein [Rhodospirillales bacterium]|nr:DUF3035 domain-containing protein [Rhodospirillales bacterium]
MHLVQGGLAVGLVLALTACGQIRKELGMDKTSPDEFRVVINAPLAIPPDYSLRPPVPGAARPQEAAPIDRARVAVFGREGRVDPDGDGEPKTAEEAFLSDAGADAAQANIRQVVDGETQAINEDNKDFVDTLVFWKDSPPQGDVVDAPAEADRIRETKALGQPVTTGDTPIVIEREKGPLEKIF